MPSPRIRVIRVILTRLGGGVSSNATLLLHSTGDTTDVTTFTADNSGFKQVDVNNVEMFRVWTSGDNGSIYIGDKLPAGFASPDWIPDNVAIGLQVMPNITGGAAAGNVGVGKNALSNLTTGAENTAIGQFAGNATEDGANNVFIGGFAIASEPSAASCVVVGDEALADIGVTNNGIAIGDSARVMSNNTFVAGNPNVTDLWAGGQNVGNAILHGKGNAIVFPDSDPHIVGAGYWSAGVLHRSSG